MESSGIISQQMQSADPVLELTRKRKLSVLEQIKEVVPMMGDPSASFNSLEPPTKRPYEVTMAESTDLSLAAERASVATGFIADKADELRVVANTKAREFEFVANEKARELAVKAEEFVSAAQVKAKELEHIVNEKAAQIGEKIGEITEATVHKAIEIKDTLVTVKDAALLKAADLSESAVGRLRSNSAEAVEMASKIDKIDNLPEFVPTNNYPDLPEALVNIKEPEPQITTTN